MKSILTLLMLVLIIQAVEAQSGPAAEQVAGNYSQVADKPAVKSEQSLAHSQIAIQQITDHILKNITYPEILHQYSVEGTLVLEVSMSATGKLERYKVVKSPSPLFDKAVLKTLATMKKVTLSNGKYAGIKKLYFPVKFSLR